MRFLSLIFTKFSGQDVFICSQYLRKWGVSLAIDFDFFKEKLGLVVGLGRKGMMWKPWKGDFYENI